jgi:hypothetical protein
MKDTAITHGAALNAQCARSRLRSNSGERIRDHGDEQIDKPKIEHDETSDEKEARYEEL